MSNIKDTLTNSRKLKGKIVARNEILMDTLYETFEVPTLKQFRSKHTSIRKRKRTDVLELNPKRKIF